MQFFETLIYCREAQALESEVESLQDTMKSQEEARTQALKDIEDIEDELDRLDQEIADKIYQANQMINEANCVDNWLKS